MKRLHGICDLLQRLFLPFVKGVLRVAIVAAQIAESQPHKNAWSPHPGAFALDRVINLVDRQRLFALRHNIEASYAKSRKASFAAKYSTTTVVSACVETSHMGRPKIRGT